MENGLPESFDGYKKLTEEERMYAHFLTLKQSNLCLNDHEKRIKALEGRKKVDTAVNTGAGLIGGAGAVFLLLKFKVIQFLTGG